MARADTVTKLPLDTWAKLMGIQPLHFNGVNLPDVRFTCQTAWHQFDWQDHDKVSREEVARAIAKAEADIEEALGYRLLPSWETDEWRPVSRPWRKELFNLNAHDLRGFNLPVEARWGWFISGGVRATSLLEAGSSITYTNTILPNNYNDRATVTVALSEALDPCEIHVFYPGHNGDPRWEIRPVEVTVSGLTATIVFRREQAIVESLMSNLGFDPNDQAIRPANGTDNDDFLTTVDVYRVFNDPQTQVTLVWEPTGDCGCGGGTCPSCAFNQQTGCLLVRGDPRLGFPVIQPAEWDATAESFSPKALTVQRAPDLVRLFYYAGLRDKSQACAGIEMDPDWARTVAIYAASQLERPPCACAKFWWERWARDRAFSDGATELAAFDISPSDLDNPFGTREGAIYAWRRVSRAGAAIGRSAHA